MSLEDGPVGKELASKNEDLHSGPVEDLMQVVSQVNRVSFTTGFHCSRTCIDTVGPWWDSVNSISSIRGIDFSMEQFAEGFTLKLAKWCPKWLCHGQINKGHSVLGSGEPSDLSYLGYQHERRVCGG